MGYARSVLVGGSMEPPIHRGPLGFEPACAARDRAGSGVMRAPRLVAPLVVVVLAIAIAAVAAAGPRDPQLGRLSADGPITTKIGRASCRERV